VSEVYMFEAFGGIMHGLEGRARWNVFPSDLRKRHYMCKSSSEICLHNPPPMSNQVLTLSQSFPHASILPIQSFVQQDIRIRKDARIEQSWLRLAKEVLIFSQ